MTDTPGGEGGPTTPDSDERRDGAIDFHSFSLAQLTDLKRVIDPATQPVNYANLLAAITNRELPKSEDPGSGARGMFSARDGWRGWIEAKRRRSPVYGHGALKINTDTIDLHGMQRTWLGIAEPSVVRVPLDSIRNVARDGERLHFESQRRFLPCRRICFSPERLGLAVELAARLPGRQTKGFEQKWNEIRTFRSRVEEIGGSAWPVYTLVSMNILVFVAMAIVYGRVAEFDMPQLIRWGANYGPATLDGQWWRLVSALFLHADPPHLLANMWVLFSAGRLGRQLYGSGAFLGVYFGAGICGFLFSVAWNPAVVCVGASGAIFGVLGAFIAFLMHQRAQLPAAIVRAHWVSTLVFIAYNLVAGAMQPNIDNAAHVGGLVSGFVLGWLLVRPLDKTLRARFPAWQTAASLVFVGAFALATFLQLRGAGSQTTAAERFARSHEWYITGEIENLRQWQTLAAGLANGAISEAEVSRRFTSEIIPFWKDAHAKFTSEAGKGSREPDEYTALALEFSRLRLDWARAIADFTRDRDSERAADAVRLMKETDRVQAQIERLQMRAHMDHRPRALAHSLFVNRVRAMLSNRNWECVKWPSRAGRMLAETDSPKDAPVREQEIACQAQRYFHEGDFEALDGMMRKALNDLNDLPGGGSSLAAQFSGLSTMLYYGNSVLEDMLGKTADWRRAVKDPLMAELVEAMVFQQWAWTARGGGTSDEVTGQGWYLFEHRSQMAAAALRSIEDAALSVPVWHDLSLDVALDLSEKKPEIRAIFDRGIERFPSYQPLYSGMLRVLMPRWQGSYEEVDKFILEVSSRSDGDQDLSMYARLYWNYFVLEQDDCNIFLDGEATWNDLDLGFAELIKLHPDSDYLLNAWAVMACQIRDPERYGELRKEVGRRFSRSAWSDKYSLSTCDAQMKALQ